MIIECLIKRDGPTHLTIDKFNYCFQENPDFGGAVVCDVTNDAHVSQLLSIGLYRKYEGAKPSASPDPTPLTDDPDPVGDTGATTDPPGDTGPDTPDGGADDPDGDDVDQSDEEGRADMTDEERDAALLNMADANMSYAKIAEVVGRSKTWVANRIKILREQ
jgi:hypothetical protein